MFANTRQNEVGTSLKTKRKRAINIHFQIKHIYLRVYHHEITKWIKQWGIGRRKFAFGEYQFGGGRGASINKKYIKYTVRNMKAVNGTCEKWTCRSSREAIIQTACCLFCLRLCSFSPDIFCNFFGNVIRRVQVWGHVVPDKENKY